MRQVLPSRREDGLQKGVRTAITPLCGAGDGDGHVDAASGYVTSPPETPVSAQ